MSNFIAKENKFWKRFLFNNSKKKALSIKSHNQTSNHDKQRRLGPVKSKSSFTIKHVVSRQVGIAPQQHSVDMSVVPSSPASTASTSEMHEQEQRQCQLEEIDDKENIDNEIEEHYNSIPKEEEEEEEKPEVEEKVENSAKIEVLQAELDQERATVNALQKQKQAITKDLDYLSLTIDELQEEKNVLVEQLEQEKIKNQNQLEDLNLLLEKIKATADDAREKAFAVDQAKLELKNFQLESKKEKEQFLKENESNNKLIRNLKMELNKSQEQTMSLKSTIDQLERTHAEKINQLLSEGQTLAMHTPQASPRITNNSATVTNAATASTTSKIATPTNRLKRKETNLETTNLDDQLLKLTKEKEKLQSHYSKIPLTGGGPQSRKRREELESMLDQVDSQLSKVKQKIKRS